MCSFHKQKRERESEMLPSSVSTKKGKKRQLRPYNTVHCPICNTPRVPQFSDLVHGRRVACNSPSCIRETQPPPLSEIPESVKENEHYLRAYQEHIRSIGGGVVLLARLQSIINVRLTSSHTDDIIQQIEKTLKKIHSQQVFNYRIAISFGSLLRHTTNPNQIMYFHASANNASIFETDSPNSNRYRLITHDQDMQDTINAMREVIESGQDHLVKRPDTKWRLIAHVNASITLLRPALQLMYVGQQSSASSSQIGRLVHIPHFLRYRGMHHFNRNPKTKRLYDDNLCFFRCLAYKLHGNTTSTTTLFHTAYPHALDISKFKGVSISEISRLESIFNLHVRIFRLCKSKKHNTISVKLVNLHHSVPYISEARTLNLNLYKKHVSLITDFKKYSYVFTCDKCNKVFTTSYALKRHTNIKSDCTKVTFTYKGGVYRNAKTIFEQLDEIDVKVPTEMRIYPYMIVYDFETFFQKNRYMNENPSRTEQCISSHHIPLSASVCSNFPGYTEPICFVKDEHEHLVHDVLDYINNLAIKIGDKVRENFTKVLESLHQVLENQQSSEPPNPFRPTRKRKGTKLTISKPHPLEKLIESLLNYIRRVPVIGFNSGRYDINLIKREFHSFFTEREERIEMKTLKRFNQYIAIYTQHTIFLDMFNYLAPGYSYANYLKAFLKKDLKGFFPYEWMDDVRKLNNTSLPPRSAFYSSLTRQTISKEDYKLCQDVWNKEQMQTFKDYLIHYNNKDVQPFIAAIQKHSEFFIERGIDMFKDGVTLPGLTLRFLFQNIQQNTPYILFNKSDGDIHKLVQKNLVGGPAIIFHRLHKSGETFIRKNKYGSESRRCKHILGVDANSLYLKCMGEAHCAGFYIVRRRQQNFKPVLSQKVSFAATEWLRYRSFIDKTEILHQYNYGGEIRLGECQVSVDGVVPNKKIVYQFHGCYWHGHPCRLNRSAFTDPKKRQAATERAFKTAATTRYLEQLGYTLISEYECNWQILCKSPEVRAIQKHWSVPRPKMKHLTEAEIITHIKNDKLFGLAQVDIHTPPELRDTFSEMTPIFKNVQVSRDDVGPHMKSFLEENEKLKRPQRQLIGSYFGEKILLGTPLLQWYLNKGLIVSKVHLVVEYLPEHTFQNFVDEVTKARRMGDKDTSCKILSDLYKLLGNSSYGKTITNKQNFTITRYVSPQKASRLLLHWSVQHAEDISENTVEVTSLPTKITHDLPIQIGFMVYQYAKLKMLSFYYDFLLKFFDLKDFELCEMDTDSLYLALSDTKLDNLVKPNLREAYFKERHLWFPSESCDNHHHRLNYETARTYNLPWIPPPCCQDRLQHDQRTPGLFKIEWEGDQMTSLNSKCYIGQKGDTSKVSCKGSIQKQNHLTPAIYNRVLNTKESHDVCNTSFRVIDHHVVTFKQSKKGLGYQYIKRKVCDDGVSSLPLDI